MRGSSRDERDARSRAGRPRGGDRAVPLVRDPVCGTYVVKAKALTSHAGGETHYFCSEDCREQWLRRTAGRETA